VKSLPRPALWRLSLIQCLAWLLALVLFALIRPETIPSIGWAGLIAILAQAFWIWRSLRSFGDSRSSGFLVGATAGLMGKWTIIIVGLVVLWRSQPDLSVAATVITVFALNTLAALAAPISISQPR
jgi:hypothetical protein